MRAVGSGTLFFVLSCVILMLNLQFAALSQGTSKYISIDEITPDMEAYCLTVFSGTEVEKFGLKVLSVVRNQQPGQDMILVLGTDERFLNSSVIHGCSGSPVYIDGRLAGALAAGWDKSLDPIYLVRPIQDMHEVGQAESMSFSQNAALIDYYDDSQPLDLSAFYNQYLAHLKNRTGSSQMYLPLSTSLPANVVEPFNGAFEGFGLMPIASGALLPSRSYSEAGKFEPGGLLALVLCGGDISLCATGTVTEVIGNQLYGFGHQFRGRGSVNYPIAAGMVHTVVTSRDRSFKFSSPGPVLGTLEIDQSSAVRGTIGQIPKTLDLTIEIDRYDDPQHRRYDCYLAVDPDLTPLILQVVLNGAVQMRGSFPMEHTVHYSGRIVVDGDDRINFDNISSQRALSEPSMEVSSAVAMLLNNPFKEAQIDSVSIEVELKPVNMTASIWAVEVNRTTVHPGQTVTALVTLKTYREEEESVKIDLKIPETLEPGKYQIQVLGPTEYQSFAAGMAPHKFRATDLASLKTGLNRVLQYRRDKLYAVMPTPSTGLIIRQHEMGQLPPTKMLLMQDSKRLIPLEPFKAWTENNITLDRIVRGRAEITLTVER